jgi:hypothetical protein
MQAAIVLSQKLRYFAFEKAVSQISNNIDLSKSLVSLTNRKEFKSENYLDGTMKSIQLSPEADQKGLLLEL